MSSKFNFNDVKKAYETIASYVKETPLEQSYYLGDDEHKYFFKLETLQRVKSFKIRGALNKMLSLTETERERGVVTISAGNHGSAVAYAASLLGIKKAVIIVPEVTPQSKIDKIEYFGGTAMIMGENYDEAHLMGMQYIEENEMTFIDAYYDDPKIYAGQGTIAIEILNQKPEIDTIIVPIGGGGLITGIAVAAKALKPEIEIIGVQTAACPAMVKAYEDQVFYQEYPVSGDTICEALVGGVGKLSYELLKEYVDQLFIVSEASIRKAVAFMIREEKFVVEGGSAATVAAVFEHSEKIKGRNVALVMSGGNIDGTLMTTLLNEMQVEKSFADRR